MRTAEVPVQWRAAPGLDREAGVLIVGVGTSRLDVRSAGMHHLAEHLVMQQVGDLPFDANATSGAECVVFEAAGTRAQVLEFVRAVADAICAVHRGPSPELVAQQQWVLATEQARRTTGVIGPWTARYGCAGPGLAELPEIGAMRATAEDVRAFARRWFVAPHARVALSFEPDGPWGVQLPDGPDRSDQVWRASARSSRRAFCETDTGAVTLSFDAEQVPGDVLVHEVLVRSLMRDLRHEHALIYSAESTICATGPGRRALLVTLDPLPQVVDATVGRALRVLDELADTGPGERLLEDARTVVSTHLSEPIELFARFVGEVTDELRGEDRVDVARTQRAVQQLSVSDVRDRVGDLASTLVLTVPEGSDLTHDTRCRLAAAGLDRRDVVTTDRRPAAEVRRELLTHAPATGSATGGARFRPTRGYYPRLTGPVRGVHLWIGPGHLTLIPRDGPALRFDARDVVVTETDPDGTVTLLTHAGGRIAVNPRHFRGAARWWKHFWDHLDAEVLHLPG